VALAPGAALKRLGGLLRPMFLIGLDRLTGLGWWLSRLVNALWLGVSSTERQRVDQLYVSFSDGDEGCVCLIVTMMTVYSSIIICILFSLCCLYIYQFYIIMFMNRSNVRLRT
jgi:hypothetical protein